MSTHVSDLTERMEQFERHPTRKKVKGIKRKSSKAKEIFSRGPVRKLKKTEATENEPKNSLKPKNCYKCKNH